MGVVKVGFYGDDFTGSSENLAQFHRSGARSRLYLGVPTAEEIAHDREIFDVLGIAGTARALSPDDMRAELRPALAAIVSFGARLFQYKLCSTFDSAPNVGSFGVAMEVADEIIGRSAIAVSAAAPDFGRYTAFGQHFARFGDDVYRLDRHPSMASHPRTPMREADLGRHLAAQTARVFGNVYLPAIRAGDSAVRLDAVSLGEGLIFDGVDMADLQAVAAGIWDASKNTALAAFAAQGLAQALGVIWAERGELQACEDVKFRIPPVETLLVLSGSCAIQNGRQIDVADQAGWKMIGLDPEAIGRSRDPKAAAQAIVGQVGEALDRKQPTVVYTARGAEGRVAVDDVPPAALGEFYAEVVRGIRSRTGLPRVVFAGGDSSSFSVKSSGARALEISVFDELQNSHVCRLSAPSGNPMDGLEVMLKGGQVGGDDYFLRAMHGTEN